MAPRRRAKRLRFAARRRGRTSLDGGLGTKAILRGGCLVAGGNEGLPPPHSQRRSFLDFRIPDPKRETFQAGQAANPVSQGSRNGSSSPVEARLLGSKCMTARNSATPVSVGPASSCYIIGLQPNHANRPIARGFCGLPFCLLIKSWNL